VVFWQSEVGISEPAAFQLHLRAPTWVSLAVLPFVSLSLEFSDNRPPVVIQHSPPSQAAEPRQLQRVDLGTVHSQGQQDPKEIHADLRWAPGGTLILAGTLASDLPTILGVGKILCPMLS